MGNYFKVVLFGAGVLFGIPIVVGLLVSVFAGMGAGILTGILAFVLILAMGWRRLKQIVKENERGE